MWSFRNTLVLSGLLMGLTAGCNEDTEGSETLGDDQTNEALPQAVSTAPRDAGARVGDAGVDKTKLWCAVKVVSDARCVVCHDGKGTAGSPMGLVTHADYLKDSPLTKGKKVFETVATRVHDRQRPMPPGRPLDVASLKAIDDWVDAGAPPGPDGGCPLPDGGTLDVTRPQ